MKEANERTSSLIWIDVEYFDRHEFQALTGYLLNNECDGLLWLLFFFFLFFYQHVDDHNIIMADQTVIKKGECLLHVCD